MTSYREKTTRGPAGCNQHLLKLFRAVFNVWDFHGQLARATISDRMVTSVVASGRDLPGAQLPRGVEMIDGRR